MTREVLTDDLPPPPPPAPRRTLPFGLVGGVVVVLSVMAGLSARATSNQNHDALASHPRGVTVVAAKATTFREERRYVGQVEPWVEARIGPQFVSAWVSTVLVRPGDRVKRGDVLATLDCRNASNATESALQQARSLEERQRAMASETARMENLLGGGFVSTNELEQKKAQVAAAMAQLEASRSALRSRTLEVDDCTLRAPFEGEIAARNADPGTFARPGAPLLTLIDRHVYRVTFDAPEVDFPLLSVGAELEVSLLAVGRKVPARISRRAPSAGSTTRALRFEVDLDAKDLDVPVGTTAELRLEVGEPRPASELPLVAAKVRGTKATVFTVEAQVAHKQQVSVLGERGSSLFVAPLPPNTRVVTEGRAALAEGDRVEAAP